MEPIKTLLPLLFLLLTISPTQSTRTQDSDTPNAYEMLESFNFPKGILPEGVTHYKLNTDGTFEVYFGGKECKFGLEAGYTLSYSNKISGKVGVGSLKNLVGVKVKVLFVWLNINEVVRSGGSLDFYVGPLSASFGVSNFEDSPRCG
ncbi:hypothetical protein QJS10_CPA02g00815 [Acorus calamus]|uniref:Uncharacterized protein n=1 Tax=Acorus calamus TaxID=4465 RepID=A0AAV9FAJ2_ACOCL|nr:hypothetical protein QJS10_CPA02g00815 [Acorus calamus]